MNYGSEQPGHFAARTRAEKEKAAAMQCAGDLQGAIGRAGLTGCDSPEPPKAGGEIMSKVEVLFSRTEGVSIRVANLQKRLKPVLIQVPEGRAENASFDGGMTELGGLLNVLAGRLALISEAIDTIDATLDL